MPNDSLIRALRRFTLTAGIALIAVPLLGPALDLLDLKTFPRHRWRDMMGFLVPLSMAMFAGVMLDLNLTMSRVAEQLASKGGAPVEKPTTGRSFRRRRGIAVLFALVVACVVIDHFEDRRIETDLVERARQSAAGFSKAIQRMADYRYEQDWVRATTESLGFMARQGSWSTVSVLVRDFLDEQPVYLGFNSAASVRGDALEPKVEHALEASSEELAYLDGVFGAGNNASDFYARSQRYRLFMPVRAEGRVVVLQFVER